MTKTATDDTLLTVCLQDLHAGAADLAERLTGVARHASDATLAALLADAVEAAHRQAARLRATGRDVDGPGNIWMAGVLDDAERDTGSVEPGPLLDIAMIGAVRKAKAAAIVSYETAVAMANKVGDRAALGVLAAILEEEKALDRALAERLAALTR